HPPHPQSHALSLHDALPIYVGAVVGGHLRHIGAKRHGGGGVAVIDPAGLHGYRRHFLAGDGLLWTKTPSLQGQKAVGRSQAGGGDRKSTRLNSSHVSISYAV